MSRVDREPVFVLHRRAWRETSLIIELLTAAHGRVAGVARAARSTRSGFFGLTEPFCLLDASWVRRGEMATLTGLEPADRSVRLAGRAIWCGLYANELLLKLTPRDDPEPGLFEAYKRLLPELAEPARQGSALRRFELALLDALGVAPDLTRCGESAAPVEPGKRYRVDPVAGPVAVPDHQGGVRGALLLALASGEDIPATEDTAALRLMRELIDHQLDGRTLNTPALFRENRK